MDHLDVAGGQQIHVGPVQSDAVAGQQIGRQHPEIRQVLDRGAAIALLDRLDFAGGLGNVDDQGNGMPAGQFGRLAQEIGGAQVGRVRLDRNGDQRIAAPFVDQHFGVAEPFFDGPVVGRGKVVQHFAHHSPHAGGVRRLGHGILEKVHVAEAGGAGEQHFGAGQEAAQMHVLGLEPGLRRENVVVQPGHQGKIVGQAAETGHGGVGVGIHQPGHDETAPGVDLALGTPCRRPDGRTHGSDPVALDGDKTIRVGVAVVVQGEDPSVFDD